MTDNKIGEHVKKLMTYSKKDLAVMYANLDYAFNQLVKQLTIKK
jgi:hypothetical protein